MVDENATRESFEDPRVLQGMQGRDALLWVPREALHDEIKECLTLVTYDLIEWPGAWQSQTAIRVFNDVKRLVGTLPEELIFTLSIF